MRLYIWVLYKGEDVDYVREGAPPDTKSDDGINLSKLRIGGRIRRAHIQKSSVENAKLSAVGGRIIREAPKESKFESQGGSVVVRIPVLKSRIMNIPWFC